MEQAEQEVATAQTKFDQQYEVTKLMLQNVQRRNVTDEFEIKKII